MASLIFSQENTYKDLGRIPFVRTGSRLNSQTSLGLPVQMSCTVWFWRRCLGNECNEITVPANCVSKNVYVTQSRA